MCVFQLRWNTRNKEFYRLSKIQLTEKRHTIDLIQIFNDLNQWLKEKSIREKTSNTMDDDRIVDIDYRTNEIKETEEYWVDGSTKRIINGRLV